MGFDDLLLQNSCLCSDGCPTTNRTTVSSEFDTEMEMNKKQVFNFCT